MRIPWLKSVSSPEQRTLLALTIIIIIAILLRVVPFQLQWWGDTGRDMLIARMIVEHGEVATAGPMAAGGHGLLKNSVVYYYFVAGLWWLTRSPFGVLLSFMAMGIGCVVVNYFSGKELGTRLTGLLAAAFTAFSHLMVLFSRVIFQPYSALFFLAVVYLGCLKTTRRPTTGWLITTTICLFMALHLHYSVLIITPLVIGLLLINWLRLWKTTTLKSRFIWPSLLVLLMLTWYSSTHSSVTNSGSTHLSTYVLQRLVFLLFPNPSTQQWEWTNPFQFISYLFNDVSGWVPTWIGGTLLLGLGWGAVAGEHIRSRFNFRFLVVMILLSSVLLTASLQGTIYNYYFSAYYFLVFLALAYLITLLNLKNRILAALMAGVVLVGLHSHHYVPWAGNTPTEFEFARFTAAAIFDDYQAHAATSASDLPAIFISEKTPLMPVFDWGNPSIWYFLELESDHQLVIFNPIFTNIQPIVTEPRFFYALCRDYQTQEQILENCLDRVFRDDERYGGKVDRNYQEILDLNAQGSNTRVYRFRRE
jgi:hypothetical protein